MERNVLKHISPISVFFEFCATNHYQGSVYIPHTFCPFILANMAEEEFAKLVVGDDSGMCKASFAGDVPRMFSLIKNEGRRPTTLRYRRGLNHKPCREKHTRSRHSKDSQIDSSLLILWVVVHGRSQLVE